MNLMFITSLPPIKCGVADYSYNLLKFLEQDRDITNMILIHSSDNPPSDLKGKSFYIKTWGIVSFIKILKLIKKEKIHVLNIQYPTLSYGYSLILQLLAFILFTFKINDLKIIVTIHEFSQTHILRKLSEIPFFLFSNLVIFTNEYEKKYASSIIPFTKNKSVIIYIGSNINVHYKLDLSKKIENSIIFFGLIRPRKGLEEFIELVNYSIKKGYNYEFKIIGSPQYKVIEYYKSMRRKTINLPIEWKVNLSEKEVSYELSVSKFAYLIYPDGVSERRGSFLACLFHKVLVLTNKGFQTPYEFVQSCVFVNSVEDVFDKINYYNQNIDEYYKKIKAAEELSEKFKWPKIAEDYLKIYKDLVKT